MHVTLNMFHAAVRCCPSLYPCQSPQTPMSSNAIHPAPRLNTAYDAGMSAESHRATENFTAGGVMSKLGCQHTSPPCLTKSRNLDPAALRQCLVHQHNMLLCVALHPRLPLLIPAHRLSSGLIQARAGISDWPRASRTATLRRPAPQPEHCRFTVQPRLKGTSRCSANLGRSFIPPVICCAFDHASPELTLHGCTAVWRPCRAASCSLSGDDLGPVAWCKPARRRPGTQPSSPPAPLLSATRSPAPACMVCCVFSSCRTWCTAMIRWCWLWSTAPASC